MSEPEFFKYFKMFDQLPHVNNGCCVFNLKLASMLIAAFAILQPVLLASSFVINPCPNSGATLVVNILYYILFAFDILLCLIAVAFIISLLIHRSEMVVIFILGSSICAIVLLLTSAASMFIMIVDTAACLNASSFIVGLLVFFLWLYFIIILNSFKNVIDEFDEDK